MRSVGQLGFNSTLRRVVEWVVSRLMRPEGSDKCVSSNQIRAEKLRKRGKDPSAWKNADRSTCAEDEMASERRMERRVLRKGTMVFKSP